MRLTQRERGAIREYVSTLVDRLPEKVERVILFGSKARGSGRRGSDTDLAVVIRGEKTPALRRAVVDPSFDPIVRFRVDLSPLLIPSSSFRKRSPFIQRLKKEGIELWSRRGRSLSVSA